MSRRIEAGGATSHMYLIVMKKKTPALPSLVSADDSGNPGKTWKEKVIYYAFPNVVSSHGFGFLSLRSSNEFEPLLASYVGID